MYKIIITTHVWTSMLFVIVAIILIYRSVNGLLKQKKFTILDKKIEMAFIILLYLGLVLGIILFFLIDPQHKNKMIDLGEARKYMTLRFWAIEHFSVMLFALILSQIGRIFTRKLNSDFQKFKYSLFYYGIATLLTLVSTGLYILNKG